MPIAHEPRSSPRIRDPGIDPGRKDLPPHRLGGTAGGRHEPVPPAAPSAAATWVTPSGAYPACARAPNAWSCTTTCASTRCWPGISASISRVTTTCRCSRGAACVGRRPGPEGAMVRHGWREAWPAGRNDMQMKLGGRCHGRGQIRGHERAGWRSGSPTDAIRRTVDHAHLARLARP